MGVPVFGGAVVDLTLQFPHGIAYESSSGNAVNCAQHLRHSLAGDELGCEERLCYWTSKS